MPDLGRFNSVNPVIQVPPPRKPTVKRRTGDQEESKHSQKHNDKQTDNRRSDDDSDQPHIDEYA